MQLTDRQLLLLEQLAYFDDDDAVINAVGLTSDAAALYSLENISLGKFLDLFDDAALEKLRSLGDNALSGNCITGTEWANIISELKADEELCSLILAGSETRYQYITNDGETRCESFVFEDPQDSGSAIMIMRGTVNAQEWADNIYSAGVADTEIETDILQYVETLPYENLTVVGHSKAAKVAGYLAVVCDKVDRAVGLDGPGYSQAFLEKYSAEIEKNAYKFTNYSLSTDFVHELMFELPGASYIFLEGYGIGSLADNHGPSKIFNEDMQLEEVQNQSEAVAVSMLRELGNYILITSQENGDWESSLEPYLENLVVILMGDLSDEEMNARLSEFIFNTDNIATTYTLSAYLMRYLFDSGMSVEDLDVLYEYFGLNSSLIRTFISEIYQVFDEIKDYGQLRYALDLSWDTVSSLFTFHFPTEALIQTFLLPTVLKYQSLAHYSASVNTVDMTTGEIRDFCQSREEDLLNVILTVEAAAFADMSAWRSYSSEEWYSQLHVESMYTYLKKYYDALSAADDTSSQRIRSVFDTVYGIDSSIGQSLTNRVSSISSVTAAVNSIASGILPEPVISAGALIGLGGSGGVSEGGGSGTSGAGTSGALSYFSALLTDRSASAASGGISETLFGGAATGTASYGVFNTEISFTADNEKIKKSKDGKFQAYGVNAKASFSAVEGEAGISGEYGAASVSASVGNVAVGGSVGLTLYETKDGTTKFNPSVSAKVEASTSVAKGEASARAGTEDYNAHAKASGSVLGASANAGVTVGMIEKNGRTEIGASFSAGAEAYVAKGEISGGITIFGIDIDLSVEGKAGAVGVSTGGSVTTNSVQGKIGASLGLGVGIGISIDWSDFVLFN